MATFKPTVRGERKDGFLQVYIRVTHRKRHGYIKTDKMITRKELTKTNDIKDPFVLNYCTERIMEYNDRLNRKDISQWTIAEVMDFLLKGNDDTYLLVAILNIENPTVASEGRPKPVTTTKGFSKFSRLSPYIFVLC